LLVILTYFSEACNAEEFSLLANPLTGEEKCGKMFKNLHKKEVRGKYGASSRETLRDDVPQSDRK